MTLPKASACAACTTRYRAPYSSCRRRTLAAISSTEPDSTPGTPYAKFTVGRDLGETRFTITPAIVEEYFHAVDADKSLYAIDGRQAAAPNVATACRRVAVPCVAPSSQAQV